jgi:hypothetical protein
MRDGLSNERDLSAHMPSCDHNDNEVRTHVLRNGVKQVKFQCLTCGSRGGAIRRDHWLIKTLTEDPPAVDMELQTRWWSEQQEIRVAEMEQEQSDYRQRRADENAAWWGDYNIYMESPEWGTIRAKVMQRDRNVCRADLFGCARFATQVHHLTYDHLFNEPLFDLIAICAPCHARLTRMDRERRAA